MVRVWRSSRPRPSPCHRRPLDWPEEDLSGRMMDGAHRFVERQIADMQARARDSGNTTRPRPAAWTRRSTGTAIGSARSSASSIRACLPAWSDSATTTTLPSLPRRAGTASIRCAGPCWKEFRPKGCSCSRQRRALLPTSSSCPMPTRRLSRSWASRPAWHPSGSLPAASLRAGANWSSRRWSSRTHRDRRPAASQTASRPGASGCTGRRFTWAAT